MCVQVWRNSILFNLKFWIFTNHAREQRKAGSLSVNRKFIGNQKNAFHHEHTPYTASVVQSKHKWITKKIFLVGKNNITVRKNCNRKWKKIFYRNANAHNMLVSSTSVHHSNMIFVLTPLQRKKINIDNWEKRKNAAEIRTIVKKKIQLWNSLTWRKTDVRLSTARCTKSNFVIFHLIHIVLLSIQQWLNIHLFSPLKCYKFYELLLKTFCANKATFCWRL